MADKEIYVAVKVDDGGSTDRATESAKKYNAELEKAARTAENMHRKTSASAALSKAKKISGVEVEEHSLGRGVANVSGGGTSARDFAEQARGLGGLVRLYATFAANIYAVGAAFNALREANNVDKMIAASNKFSSVVGSNLTSIAKSLQVATDNTLAFQDAIKFTNIGTAAGLSAKEIKNLTVIAKGAATALGRDVGESIQRIIQGTAKQEQEILDELGIFVKSKKAFEDYARARNLKVDDLSATQRTLAYAEAVAKAGEKWKEFSDIQDPYAQLIASGKQAMQEVLSFFNSFLTPVIKLFAESTDAIKTFGALIVGTLVKRALPEIKEGFLDLLTFDAQRAKMANMAIRANLTNELAALTAQAEKAQKALIDLQGITPGYEKKEVRKNLARQLIEPEMLQTGSGRNISYGLSAEKLGNKLLSPETLSNYKTVEDINRGITEAVQEQVKAAGKNIELQQRMINDLKTKGIIEATSTAENIILTEKAAKAHAERYLPVIKAAETSVKEQAKAQAEVLQLTNTIASKQALLEKAGGASEARGGAVTGTIIARTSAQTASTRATENNTKAMTANAAAIAGVGNATKIAAASINVLTTNTIAAARARDTFGVAWTNTGNELAKTREALAGQGILAHIKEIGIAVVGMGASAKAAGANLTGAGAAGAKAGALIASGMHIARLGATALMSAFGPIMMIWTLWELFGDKIRELFGWFNPAVAKAQETAKEAAKTLQDTMNKIGETFRKADEIISDPMNSAEDVLEAYKRRGNAIRSLMNDYEAAAEAKRKLDQLEKDSGKKDGGLKLDEKQIKILEEARSAGNIGKSIMPDDASTKRVFELLDKIESSRAAGNTKELSNAFENLNIVLESFGRKIQIVAPEMEKLNELRAGRLETFVAGLKSLSDYVSKSDALNRLKAFNAGFKDVEAYKTFTAFEKSLKAMSDAAAGANIADSAEGLQGYGAALTSNLETFEQVKKVLQDQKKPYDALDSQIRLLTNAKLELAEVEKLLTERQKLATSGTKEQLDANDKKLAEARSRLQGAQANAARATQGVAGEVATGIKLIADLGKTSAKELTEAEKTRISLYKQEIAQQEALIKSEQALLSVRERLNSFTSKIDGDSSRVEVGAKLALISREEDLALKKAELAKYEATARAGKDADGKRLKAEAEETYKLQKASIAETSNQQRILLDLEVIEKRVGEELRRRNEARARENELLNYRKQIEDASIQRTSDEARRRMEALGYLKEEIDLQAVKDTQAKNALEYSREAARLESERAAKLQDLQANVKAQKEAAARTFGTESGAYKTAIAQADTASVSKQVEINEQYDTTLKLLLEILGIKQSIAAEDEKHKKLLADQAKEMSKITKLGSSIEKMFEGSGLEKQAKGFANLIKVSTSGKQKLEVLDKNEAKRQEEVSRLKKMSAEEITKLDKKQQADRLNFIAQDKTASEEYAKSRVEREWEIAAESISALKSAFAEKTAAYKVLDGIEKAMHAYKMYTLAVEMAGQIQATVVSVAESIKRTAANAPVVSTEAAKGTPGPWPVKLAAGLAAFAWVMSMIGGGGKGSAPTPAGMSAKDRQETQGTGMSWVDGKKVENGGGVFGDAEAKSESIKKSIDIIKDNSIEGLSFDRKMLSALESIDRAISGASTSLYRMPGVRTGTAFGTKEGSTSSKNLWGIFGSKKQEVEIIDSGIKLAGSFKDLAAGTSGLIKLYETVKTTTTKSGFLGLGKKTSTSIDTNIKDVTPDINKAVASIFTYANDLFIKVGATVGKTAEEVDAQLSTINFDQLLSLRGLKGEDLEKEFNAVISSMLDTTADKLFSEMKRFQQFGEGMLETVVRVVDTNKKLNDGLNAIAQSSALKSANKTLDYDITEKLVTLIGDLGTFNDQIEFFRDTFLTEAERIAPVAVAVKQELLDMNLAWVDTREEFKQVVQSLDLTTSSGQDTYVRLMALAESFAEVYQESGKLLEAEEYRNKLIGMEIEGLRLLGMETAAVAAERGLELEELNKLAPAQRDQLVYYQKVLWAMEDALALYEAETDLLGTLGYTYQQTLNQRELELNGLTEQAKAVKRWQYAVEDYNASMDLMLELYNLTGQEAKATAISRERELRGLNDTDKAIKKAIYAMEDEQSLREKILETKEKEKTALEGTISTTRDYIKSIKDYRSSLLTGNQSILNPVQRYEQIKGDALRLFATSVDKSLTDKERKEARDKLQNSTKDWLDAAKVLFASSEAYNSDFQTVLSMLDAVTAAAGDELSDAEKQLQQLEESTSFLESIEDSTKTTAQLLQELTVLQQGTAAALAAVPADLASVYNVGGILTAEQLFTSLSEAMAGAFASVLPTGSASILSTYQGINQPSLGQGIQGPVPLNPVDLPPALSAVGTVTMPGPDVGTPASTADNSATVESVNNLNDNITGLRDDIKQGNLAIVDAEIRSALTMSGGFLQAVTQQGQYLTYAINNNTFIPR